MFTLMKTPPGRRATAAAAVMVVPLAVLLGLGLKVHFGGAMLLTGAAALVTLALALMAAGADHEGARPCRSARLD